MVANITRRNVKLHRPETGVTTSPGPFLAEVMRNQDPLYSGRLWVWIPDFGGDPKDESSWVVVRYVSPYYGVQPLKNRLPPNKSQESDSEIQSYGFWMQPPDLGVKVLVIFADGDRSRGFWIGCIPEIGSHAAIPGQDLGDFDIFEPENYEQAQTDIKQLESKRPPHSTKETFDTQGLAEDKLRGPVTSSSFRESPSQVFGFNTPGSHSFVMDDGDEDGNSKLVRIRTAAGNQIMMNDDAGLIYVVNAQGTGWIEISPSGQIDVYGAAGINLATPGDVNIHADNDVNINAGNCIKMVAAKGAKLQGTEECQVHGKNLLLEGVESVDIHSCMEIKITSFKDTYMKSFENTIIHAKCLRFNSGSVKEADQVPPEQPEDVSGYQTTVARAPSKEPYKEHDNGSGGAAGSDSSLGSRLSDAFGQVTSAITSIAGTVTNTVAGFFRSPGVPTTSSAESDSGFPTGPSGFPSADAAAAAAAAASSSDSLERNAVPTGPSGFPSVDAAAAAAAASSSDSPVPIDLPIGPSGFPSVDAAAAAAQSLPIIQGQSVMSAIPSQGGGGDTGCFAKGVNCERPADFGPGGTAIADGAPIESQTPAGKPLTPAEEDALFKQLENQEASRRAAAGLPREFSQAERNSIKGILASEGGSSAGNLATMLNRSYSSRVSIEKIVFAKNQFTPAAAASTGVRDIIAGSDPGGARRFVGGYTNAATENLRSAVGGYEPLRAAGVNYFNARALGARQGRVVLDAGNWYQVGGPGNFAFQGEQNYRLFLERNGLLQ